MIKCIERGAVLWFTGLPASGKTTVARLVARRLNAAGYRVELLDGDWVRRTINVGAGFSREERWKHLLRVAWIARLLGRNGVIVLCSFVSPYRGVRREIRRIVSEEVPFVEIWVKCGLRECINRDPKGLYKRALKGEITNMTGLGDPYEHPEAPDLILNSEVWNPEFNAKVVLDFLARRFGIDA